MTVDVEAALTSFDLRRWLIAKGFSPQGRRSEEFIQDCPFCRREQKYSVNPARRRWRCFVCRKPASLFEVIAAFEGSYQRAVEVIVFHQAARKGTIAFIPEDEPQVDARARPRGWRPKPIDVPASFRPLDPRAPIHPYIVKRRLEIPNLVAIGAGICTDGSYQDRLVFPVRRRDGAWLYFQARALWEREEHPDPKRYRKTLNPSVDDEHASASEVLLGLELIQMYGLKHAALVEGPTDWTQMPPGTVASFGKQLSDDQINLLVDAGVRTIDLCYDPDAWLPDTYVDTQGRVHVSDRPSAAQRAAERLSLVVDVRVCRWPDNFDPGDYDPTANARWLALGTPWGAGSRLRQIR
jgi:hypothetical protein